MKRIFTLLALLLMGRCWAQQIDSTKAQPKETKNQPSLSKFKETGRFQSQLNTGSTSTATGQSPALQLEKAENKRVESSYQYENGRVTGGKTTLKLGKKKQ